MGPRNKHSTVAITANPITVLTIAGCPRNQLARTWVLLIPPGSNRFYSIRQFWQPYDALGTARNRLEPIDRRFEWKYAMFRARI